MSFNSVSFHVHVRFFVSCEQPARRGVLLTGRRILGTFLCRESLSSHTQYGVSGYVKECD